jgi:hypothetical protein
MFVKSEWFEDTAVNKEFEVDWSCVNRNDPYPSSVLKSPFTSKTALPGSRPIDNPFSTRAYPATSKFRLGKRVNGAVIYFIPVSLFPMETHPADRSAAIATVFEVPTKN